MPSTKRHTLKRQQQATPMRSRQGRGAAGRHGATHPCASTTAAMTRSKSPKAASSSEKETPTIVLSAMTKNISPYNLSTNCDHPSSSERNETERDDFAQSRVAVMGQKRGVRDNIGTSTQRTSRSTRKNYFRDLSEESSSGGRDEEDAHLHTKKKFRPELDNDSSEENEHNCHDNVFENENIVNAIQHLLQNGIASICRLRKLFPANFFQTFGLEGGDDCTSVTQFHVAYIEEALRKSVSGECDDEEYEYEGDDDMEERSMIKSISTKRTTQKLSPLTGASQWLSQYETETSQRRTEPRQPDFGDDMESLKKWQKQAMEALTLVEWMKNTTTILSEGKLARVVFGICDDNELIESYSFQLSFVEQNQPGELQMTQFKDMTELFFQNLNGYSAGSATLVPAKTQSSFASQAFTQSSSQYFTQQGGASQSFGLTQQQSILMSMTQSVRSIRASAKKRCGYSIPDSRYMSLDVKFTDEVEVHELPEVFQEQEEESTSPLPTEDNMNDEFVVTPLGSISESCLAGLKFDVHAYSKSNNEDDDKSVQHFSQHRHSRTDPESTKLPTPERADSQDSDSESLAYAIPKGLVDKNVYLPCKFLGHRHSTKVNGDKKEEFKLKFENEILTSKGMKKQWISTKNVLSSNEMHTMIRDACNKCCKGNKVRGSMGITTSDVKSIAYELRVEENVVKNVAKRANIAIKESNKSARK